MKDGATPNRIAVERRLLLVYEAEHGQGHRQRLVVEIFNDNSGSAGKEGFIGLGRTAALYPSQ